MAASTGVPPDWSRHVLSFWFGELDRKGWFTKSDATDAAIRQRFLGLYEAIANAVPDTAKSDADTALATVLVLDQFPRNMFRGSPRAFATDPLACVAADHAIAGGLDRLLEIERRVFLYLPFEHSESLADQERAVSLIAALGDDEYTRYAVAHRDIVARFGRFPHRNAVLGRASTAEELEFLKTPGSSF